jgi:DNA-directed RNA polymerase specialized sigma24 family protein
MSKDLKHYGTPRHSGRYPWGSGEDPEQRNKSFLGRVDELKKKGLSEKEIADGMGLSIQQLRAKKSLAKNEIKKENIYKATKLRDKGYSYTAIGKERGVNESVVRSWLDPVAKERSEANTTISNMLRKSVEEKGYVDVGSGVERHIGVSRTRLKTAISQLEEEGHLVTYVQVQQLGTGKKTTIMVLSKPKNKDAVEVIKLLNQDKTTKDPNAKAEKIRDIAKKMGIDESEVESLIKESYSDVYANKDKIRMITDYSEDGGVSVSSLEKPRSVNSNRIKVRHAEEGGTDKDGLIELRRGVDDISLGNAKYAQVRIAVDDTHYMKGMAIYSDDIPKGFDILYNSNKPIGSPKDKIFKEMKTDKNGNIDPDNPFGATVRQRHYIDSKGEKQLSALNIVNEEGEWSEKWSKSLSSQMLSKQSTSLARKQLGLAYNIKKEEYDDIMSLTNPVVQKKLLKSFADDCDSSAVHLKAAALPRTGWHVLLPFPNIKETEIYAPNYNNGDKVVLIRYPHAGLFEIPELTVNNKYPEPKKTLKQAKDAVGIHQKVAEKLSGADFDGDTALIIPNNNKQIKTAPTLKALKDFDPKSAYKPYDGMVTIDGGVYNEKTDKVDYGNRKPRTQTKQMKMGDISNLITDMTIMGGASNFDEIARAVKHSMVVIDSEKHHLDYKRSYVENGIAELKKKYQGGSTRGASTLISRAASDKRVNDRKEGVRIFDPITGKDKVHYIDPRTGKKLYTETGETYTNRYGKVVNRTIKTTKMEYYDDAFKLSSGTPMEAVYATHANKLKGLANEARKSYLNAGTTPTSRSAKKTYEKEVSSLMSSLNTALKNAPLERQAQLLANSALSAKISDNPGMDPSEIKKLKGQELARARVRTGAHKNRIEISDRQWEAIQAGAVSTNTLMQILDNTDLDRIKQLATPRTRTGLTPGKQQRVKSMLELGYTQADIADALGVSVKSIIEVMDK